MKVGLFPMVADILHAGHILAIKEAKEHCDYLIIALHCNPIYKTPVQSVYERYIQLDAVKYVDKVIPYNDKKDIATLISSLDYDIYFLGSDHKGEDFECKELLEYLGVELYYLKRNHVLSSSDLKNRVIKQNENIAKSNCS